MIREVIEEYEKKAELTAKVIQYPAAHRAGEVENYGEDFSLIADRLQDLPDILDRDMSRLLHRRWREAVDKLTKLRPDVNMELLIASVDDPNGPTHLEGR